MNDKKEKIVLDVAYQPQVRTGADPRRIMIEVIIALMPALVVAIIQFGWYPIAVCLVSMASAVFFEWAYRKLMKKTCTIGDCSWRSRCRQALLCGCPSLAPSLP